MRLSWSGYLFAALKYVSYTVYQRLVCSTGTVETCLCVGEVARLLRSRTRTARNPTGACSRAFVFGCSLMFKIQPNTYTRAHLRAGMLVHLTFARVSKLPQRVCSVRQQYIDTRGFQLVPCQSSLLLFLFRRARYYRYYTTTVVLRSWNLSSDE